MSTTVYLWLALLTTFGPFIAMFGLIMYSNIQESLEKKGKEKFMQDLKEDLIAYSAMIGIGIGFYWYVKLCVYLWSKT